MPILSRTGEILYLFAISRCERLYTSFVGINHLKSFQKSQKSTLETEPDGNPQESDITYSELSTVGSSDAIDLAECLVLSGSSASVGSPNTAFEKSVKFTTATSDTTPPSGKESNSDVVQTTTVRESQTLAVKQTTNGDGDSPPRKSSSGGPMLQQGDVPPRNQPESHVKTLLRANTVPSIPHSTIDGEAAVPKSLRKGSFCSLLLRAYLFVVTTSSYSHNVTPWVQFCIRQSQDSSSSLFRFCLSDKVGVTSIYVQSITSSK